MPPHHKQITRRQQRDSWTEVKTMEASNNCSKRRKMNKEETPENTMGDSDAHMAEPTEETKKDVESKNDTEAKKEDDTKPAQQPNKKEVTTAEGTANEEAEATALAPEKGNSFKYLKSIVELAKTFGISQNVRENWFQDPCNVASRDQHLTNKNLDKYIGLESVREEMQKLFDHGGRGRISLGLLNAVSGAGKSSTFQYCEQYFNSSQSKSHPVALAVTFNRSNKMDTPDLPAANGLAMRIAERFLMQQGEFDKFQEMWKKHFMDVTMVELVQEIYELLKIRDKKRNLLIMVDEPGLCGGEVRKTTDKEEDRNSYPQLAREVVGATSLLRQELNDDDYAAMRTRFVVSSLKPVYDGKEILDSTTTGGKITWIAVPYVKSYDEMKNALSEKLKPLKKRMAEKDFKQATDFILAISGGHWATLVAIIEDLLAKQDDIPVFDFSRVQKWLPVVYFENVRDVVVTLDDPTSQDVSVTKDPVFEDLVALALLGKQYSPFEDIVIYNSDRKSEADRNLNELAYKRIISNRIMATDGNVFDKIVPRLSLFLIAKWCEEKKEGMDFSDAVRTFLQHAGHHPESLQPVESEGVAFERVALAFIQAKFIAWKRTSTPMKKLLRVPTLLRLVEDGKTSEDEPFFPGHQLLSGDLPGLIKVPTDGGRLLQIKGKGGFRQRLVEPKQFLGETGDAFNKRIKKWSRKTLKELKFVGIDAPKLFNGDVVSPGAKNQAHSDGVTVVDFDRSKDKDKDKDNDAFKEMPPRRGELNYNEETNTKGLVFNQFKYSKGDATTALEVKDIKTGLDNLLKERGFLFELSEETQKHGNQVKNQIAMLNVPEKNVVYCWSVLRKTPKIAILRQQIQSYVRKIGFKGCVVVAVLPEKKRDQNAPMDQALRQYGETFKDLALIAASRPPVSDDNSDDSDDSDEEE